MVKGWEGANSSEGKPCEICGRAQDANISVRMLHGKLGHLAVCARCADLLEETLHEQDWSGCGCGG
jgi:ribosome-binding protein aMBF1 (putative translation factor)